MTRKLEKLKKEEKRQKMLIGGDLTPGQGKKRELETKKKKKQG